MERDELRREILRQREMLSAEDRQTKSLAINENFQRLIAEFQPATIFLYINFRSEVETMDMLRQALGQNIRVAVPLTLQKESRLEAYEITDPARQLRPGYCNIPEPDPEQAVLLDPAKIDLVVLPGSVFDLQGNRLGYGGGYYDRFLANEAPKALRVGLAYEMQLVDKVPAQAHDEPLDYLITEARVIKTQSSP
jgi:5-formyltetrahydrofolate cyclo-ligase